VAAGSRFISDEKAAGHIGRAVELVATFHRSHQLRPGMPSSSLASQLAVERSQLAVLVEQSAGSLVDDGATIRAAGFEPTLSGDDHRAWSDAKALLAASLAVPRATQLGMSEELIHALVRQGDLVQVDADLVYLPDQVEDIVSNLGERDQPFTVSEFREGLGVSRRQAVPLLEWLDRSGYTVRNGDLRRVRR
jgi:selenocysteine-specific elongation factor